MTHLDSILTLMTLFMAALISPGPDFALIVKNSLTYSRKTAVITAFGIACGAIIHTSYILLGIGELLINNPNALRIFTYIGASYLIYIGYKGITAKARSNSIEDLSHKHDISIRAAFSVGFITCILNPKAILFLTSMFTVIVQPEMPLLLLVTFGIIIFFQTFIWYSIVAVFLSGKRIREKVSSIEHWINRITGVILIVIGVKLFF